MWDNYSWFVFYLIDNSKRLALKLENSWLVDELKLKPFEFISTQFRHKYQWTPTSKGDICNRNWRNANSDRDRTRFSETKHQNVSKWVETLLLHARRLYAAYAKIFHAIIVSTVSLPIFACKFVEICLFVGSANEVLTFYHVSSICRCIRVIARNIDECNCDDWDLSQLPSTIKTDLIQLNMKLSIGFTNEMTFIQLLTPNVTQLMFRSSIVTDPMLKCIGERCKYLQELRIFDSKWSDRQLQMTTDGLIACIRGLKFVKAIQIAECDKVNDKFIGMIGQHCKHLESLWLNDCKHVTDQSSEYLRTMQLNDLNLANTSVRLPPFLHCFHFCFCAEENPFSLLRLQMNGYHN